MLLPPEASGRMLAALNLGHFGVKLHGSDDAGASWQELGRAGLSGAAGRRARAGLEALADLVARRARRHDLGRHPPGGCSAPRTGARPGSWSSRSGTGPERLEWFGGGYDAPGIHSICPHPGNDRELLLGISCGGVWVTRDDGASWSLQADGMRAAYMPPEQAGNPNVQDPHAIVRSVRRPVGALGPASQRHLPLDRQRRELARDHERAAVELRLRRRHRSRRRRCAWFVPGVADQQRVPVGAALAVNRTRDGGRSFETLRAGLPQADCYDLVYRHGLAVDAGGRRLLMASTTGNCWASDDAGESWQEVAMHLPPVYAVRIG
jgi:hypothetical protein